MNRPVIRDLERSRADITLETLAALALILLLGITVYYYPILPESVPDHFDFSGRPEGTVLIMPILGIIMYAGLTILGRYPHVYNYPCAITESNARRQYSVARQLVSAVKLLSLAVFTVITWTQITTALGTSGNSSLWFLLVSTLSIPIVLGFYLVRALRSRGEGR